MSSEAFKNMIGSETNFNTKKNLWLINTKSKIL
jgi:hypothetical protein